MPRYLGKRIFSHGSFPEVAHASRLDQFSEISEILYILNTRAIIKVVLTIFCEKMCFHLYSISEQLENITCMQNIQMEECKVMRVIVCKNKYFLKTIQNKAQLAVQ